MKNKVLVKIICPEIEQEFDLFIPVNEIMWKINKMIVKCINDLTYVSFNPEIEYILMNKENGRIYNNNEIVIDTDIRNATELILFSK